MISPTIFLGTNTFVIRIREILLFLFFGHCLAELGASGRCKPPTGLGQSPGGGLDDEAPKTYGNLVFHSTKTTAQEALV